MSKPCRSWWVPRIAMLFFTGAAAPDSFAAERPSLVNTRITTPFSANGHSSTLDGRVFVGNIREDPSTTTTYWVAKAFRPEAVTYDAQGKPDFSSAFSYGRIAYVKNGENALAFCFTNAARPYSMVEGLAVYQPYIFDSMMFNGPNVFRRRPVDIRVTQPFTAQADVSSFTTGNLETLTTVTGATLRGIEPTMTSDGRLLIFQGAPSNDGAIDHLMYSYNPTPCAASGWSTPRPLSMMYSDTSSGVQRYPLARQNLKAATGELFGDTTSGALLRGAYPWVDHEGRNVTYTGVIYTDGARREAVSLIGADTGWTAYHLDGAINTGRHDIAHLFYSGPMWNFEQERAPEQNFPRGTRNENTYLPVTKSHDVLALFGSNTSDYNEVDLGELRDPFQLLHLPMNELVTRAGAYDLTRTPDASGYFFTGTLTGTAFISAGNFVTQSTSGSLWEPHGKGKALLLPGGGALTVNLTDEANSIRGVGGLVRGFTVQLAVKPDSSIHADCTQGNPYRYLLQKAGALDLIYEADDTVQMSFVINGTRVRLGRSPPLPRNAWTHLAYTYDGVTGSFREYINGVPSGRMHPGAPGSFRLGTGVLSIGAGNVLNTQACPINGEGSFKGAIDEVRFFNHARSARTICMTSPGADCLDKAITDTPTEGHFGMSQQLHLCNSYWALGTRACSAAMHRVCAQRGAHDALANSTNVSETIQQLIGNRPPISLLGVLAGATTTDVSVACGPIQHESMAVTFEELSRLHTLCTDDRVAQTFDCTAAAHRWCNALGWTTGQIFEVTSRPWVGCFNSGLIQEVTKDQLGPASNTGAFMSTDSKLEVSQWCQARGYGAGVVQELRSGYLVQTHCFQPAVTVPWKINP